MILFVFLDFQIVYHNKSNFTTAVPQLFPGIFSHKIISRKTIINFYFPTQVAGHNSRPSPLESIRRHTRSRLAPPFGYKHCGRRVIKSFKSTTQPIIRTIRGDITSNKMLLFISQPHGWFVLSWLNTAHPIGCVMP